MYFRRLLLLVTLLTTGAVSLSAGTIVSVTGPEVTTSGSLGIFSDQSVAVSFTVGHSYSDVTIAVDLGSSFSGNAYLTNQIGSGTTAANEIASSPFNSSFNGSTWASFQPVLQGINLPGAGTYYLVLATTDFNPPQGILCTDTPTVLADVGASNGTFFNSHVAGPYPPAEGFGPYVFSQGEYIVSTPDAGAPEPSTMAMLLASAAALAFRRRHCRGGNFPHRCSESIVGGCDV
jgi:hypothetical protein